MTTTSNRTNAKTSKSERLLGISDVAQKLDMSYHEARNFLVRVPVASTGERGAHLYKLEDITKAREANAVEASNEAQPGTKEWHEVEKIRRQVEKLDVELEGMRGKVLDREDVRAGVMAICQEFAKHLDEQEAKLPPLVAGLTPTEAQPIIAQYNTKVRDALSRYAANY